MTTLELLQAAKQAWPALAAASTETKNVALGFMADSLEANCGHILDANRLDVEAARGQISEVMLDRLSLSEKRIFGMAEGIRQVAALPDPVGKVICRIDRPNGLIIEKTAVPLGVVAIIYESRPNVTSDAAVLAIKSGNACVLRGGKEAFRSANAITGALKAGLEQGSLPSQLLAMVQDTSRGSAMELMTAVGLVDLLIPRGGEGLINACVEHSKVPCIETGTGICHIYVDASTDFDMALNIIENAKTSRPSVCNAAEVCLVHKDIAAAFLPLMKKRLIEERSAAGKQPVELRLDPEAAKVISGTPAGPDDFDREFLDYILAVKVVDGMEAAIAHIARHSTGHSEAVVTRNDAVAARFVSTVDSAAVYVNASTRFTDGGEFGLGCEMGISTQKTHARGPMGLNELTTYKYIIRGSGQIRE